jgi:YHS domain-containing protein
MRTPLFAAIGLVLIATIALAAPATKIEPLCPVSGHACDPDAKADFEGGKVCFCCEKCVKAFEADAAKFAAKARQQLVVTGQMVQKGCPLSGGPVKDGTQIDVGGVAVGFCCNNCKGKVAKGSPEEQVGLVFGTGKGFALAQ